MIAMPKINGAVGIVLRGIVAIVTGPNKIEGMKADSAERFKVLQAGMDEIKTDVKALAGDVRETKGYIKGHVAGHKHGGDG